MVRTPSVIIAEIARNLDEVNEGWSKGEAWRIELGISDARLDLEELQEVIDEVVDFTPPGATKLQKMSLMSMFSQWSLSLENKMLNLIMVIDLAERMGKKEDAETYNKMLKDAGKEIVWIDGALKLIAAGKWSEFYSYIGKGYDR